MGDWDQVRLGKVLSLDLEVTTVDRDALYPIVGVLNRGRGLLWRDPILGAETSYKVLNRIRPNQVVYSRLKAFEGAITVVPSSSPTAYASQEFPTFSCTPRLLPLYFALVTTTPRLWDDLQNLSTGMGGRRERVKPNDFLTIEIALPSLAEQRRIIDVIAAVDAHIEAWGTEADVVSKMLGSVRHILDASAGETTLRDLAAVDGIQIGPFGSQLHAPSRL